MISIFLCHSSKDKGFARRLSEDLKNNGIKVWIDEAEIKVGDSLIEKIEEGIEELQYLGIILSPNSSGSSWVKKELNVAMLREIKAKRVKVLPILYKECKIPIFLEEKKYADFTKNYQEGLTELLTRLIKNDIGLIEKEKKSEYKVETSKRYSSVSFPNGEYHYYVRNYENTTIKLSEISIKYWHKDFPLKVFQEDRSINKYVAPFEGQEFIFKINFLSSHDEYQKHIGKQIGESHFLQNVLMSPLFKFEINGECFEKKYEEHSSW